MEWNIAHYVMQATSGTARLTQRDFSHCYPNTKKISDETVVTFETTKIAFAVYSYIKKVKPALQLQNGYALTSWLKIKPLNTQHETLQDKPLLVFHAFLSSQASEQEQFCIAPNQCRILKLDKETNKVTTAVQVTFNLTAKKTPHAIYMFKMK